MLTYLTSKFEEEYHHLNLWYFVFFFYGIIFYFKSVDLLFDLKLFDKVFFCSVLFSILLFIVVFFAKKKEKLILTFFTSIILSFVLGTGVASFKLNSIHTNPIEKADVLDIEAKISEIKTNDQWFAGYFDRYHPSWHQ
jgi:hypothetical protein